jgi:hypothetical protein
MATQDNTSNEAGNSETPVTKNDYSLDHEIWKIYAFVKGAQAIISDNDKWEGSSEQLAAIQVLDEVQLKLEELANQVDECNTEGALRRILEANHEPA